MSDPLKQYSVEIHGNEMSLTLEQLIESHRHMRKFNMGTTKYRNRVLEEAREQGHKQGLAMVNREYIKIEELKKMPMWAVAELLYDGEIN